MNNKAIILIASLCIITVSSCSKTNDSVQYEDEKNFSAALVGNNRSVRITEYFDFRIDKNTINIPPKINGLPVSEIGPGSMADGYFFKVTIPNTVVNIMEWSFSGNYIDEVGIPNGVNEIGAGAFMNNNLSLITLPDTVKKIGYRAFYGNPLKTITIGSDVELESIRGYDTVLNSDWVYSAFEDTGFDQFYNESGKQGGTYIMDGMWRLE